MTATEIPLSRMQPIGRHTGSAKEFGRQIPKAGLVEAALEHGNFPDEGLFGAPVASAGHCLDGLHMNGCQKISKVPAPFSAGDMCNLFGDVHFLSRTLQLCPGAEHSRGVQQILQTLPHHGLYVAFDALHHCAEGASAKHNVLPLCICCHPACHTTLTACMPPSSGDFPRSGNTGCAAVRVRIQTRQSG